MAKSTNLTALFMAILVIGVLAHQANALVPFPLERSLWDMMLPSDDPFRILEQTPLTVPRGVESLALARADWKEVVEGKKWHRAERTNGKFWRQFKLPSNADLDHIKAHLEDGMLRISVPKLAEEQKRQSRIINIVEGFLVRTLRLLRLRCKEISDG